MRMSFAFGRPSCGRALRCVAAPNLWTCRRALRCRRAFRCVWAPILRTRLSLRWGGQLPDVPCVTLGRPTFLLRIDFFVWAPILRTRLALRLGTHLADAPCVAFGHPSCGRASHCIGAPNLGEAVLKSLPPSQNLFLSILQVVFSPSAPLCGRFRCG
jgi:hypothetical protein